MTRRMKADLEHQSHQDESLEGRAVKEEYNDREDEESREFFNENELEKGIPLADQGDEDILYNVS